MFLIQGVLKSNFGGWGLPVNCPQVASSALHSSHTGSMMVEFPGVRGHFVLLYTVISNSRGNYTILRNLGLSLYNLYGGLHAVSTPEKALISGHEQEVVH